MDDKYKINLTLLVYIFLNNYK